MDVARAPRTAAAAIATTAALLCAGPAAAQTLPGDSAIDQYTENVPGARGDEPADPRDRDRQPLPERAADRLERLGRVGERTATVAELSAPEPLPERDAVRLRARAEDEGGGPGGVIEGVLRPASGGLGVLLPLILLATLVAAVAYAYARRRAAGGVRG